MCLQAQSRCDDWCLSTRKRSHFALCRDLKEKRGGVETDGNGCLGFLSLQPLDAFMRAVKAVGSAAAAGATHFPSWRKLQGCCVPPTSESDARVLTSGRGLRASLWRAFRGGLSTAAPVVEPPPPRLPLLLLLQLLLQPGCSQCQKIGGFIRRIKAAASAVRSNMNDGNKVSRRRSVAL